MGTIFAKVAKDMKEISLSKGMVSVIEDQDLERVSKLKWHAWQPKSGKTWYAVSTVRKEDGSKGCIYLHRLILNLKDPKIQADHINGDGLDNRRSNLRSATNQQNQRNKGAQKNNALKSRGVTWRKDIGKFRATIKLNGKQILVGNFITLDEASNAYQKKAKDLFGEFFRI